jgi:hypothetical protein
MHRSARGTMLLALKAPSSFWFWLRASRRFPCSSQTLLQKEERNVVLRGVPPPAKGPVLYPCVPRCFRPFPCSKCSYPHRLRRSRQCESTTSYELRVTSCGSGLAFHDCANQKKNSQRQEEMHPPRPFEHRSNSPDDQHHDGNQHSPIDQLTLLGGISILCARGGELHF